MSAALFESCSGAGESGCTATWLEAFRTAWYPRQVHAQMSGYAGFGIHLEVLPQLLPSLALSLVIYAIRESLCSPLVSVGRRLGIRKQRTVMKFQNQAWLAIFYICSTLFGYYALKDEPFFAFPLRTSAPTGESAAAAVSMWNHIPKAPSFLTLLYYNYAIGFYLTELTTLFVYGKRTDFLEMAAHHVFTLALLVFSHLGYFHRVGGYVLFIHDASDILLCVAKMIGYCSAPEWLTDLGFLGFTVSFVYFRLFMLPMLSKVTWGLATKLVPFTYNFWFLAYLLHVPLQLLHVYWFCLIVKVAVRTFKVKPLAEGERRTKDMRSSDDDEADEEVAPSATPEKSSVDGCVDSPSSASDGSNEVDKKNQ